MIGQIPFSFQNILENQGLGIAITGMSIVFSALGLITFFLWALPKVLARLEHVLPAEPEHHSVRGTTHTDDVALAVAIGFALLSKTKNEQ